MDTQYIRRGITSLWNVLTEVLEVIKNAYIVVCNIFNVTILDKNHVLLKQI